ncbi:MAG TPA: hypothetical protein VIT91_05540 [Chthoniobacterales bacterium]
MPSANKHRVIKFGCHDTRRNLPLSTSSKCGESNFLARFEKVYFESELKTAAKEQKFATGREFALDGFGRADLLFIAWTHLEATEDFTALALRNRLRLTAIEAKIKDWRKGLMQAARYRFFANRALLVLPPEAVRTALTFLTTFRDLNVGLWEFDTTTNRLRKHFTPRSGRPINSKAREKAVHAISLKLC